MFGFIINRLIVYAVFVIYKNISYMLKSERICKKVNITIKMA